MANTYTLINSTSLSNNSTYEITFSAIPATFDDLNILVSTRDFNNGAVDGQLLWRLNGEVSGYSDTALRGNGSAAASARASSVSYNGWTYAYTSGSTSTASTFGNAEIYIPKYQSTTKKSHSFFGVSENNATTAYVAVAAELANVTSTITSIAISSAGGAFASGSTFWLYGIKNS